MSLIQTTLSNSRSSLNENSLESYQVLMSTTRVHQNPICKTKVPDPQLNKCVCACVRTFRLHARVKQCDHTKITWLAHHSLCPFCLSAASPPTHYLLMFRPSVPLHNHLLHLTPLTSDPLTLTSQPRDPILLIPYDISAAWKKNPTKQHALCVRETQAGFFCTATSPLITYSSAWMYSRVHMRALLCCIIPFMRLHRPYGKQKEYISKPQGDILLRYTVRALFCFTLLCIICVSQCCHYSHCSYLYWKSELLTFPKCSAKCWATSVKHPDSDILSLFIPMSLWGPEIFHI